MAPIAKVNAPRRLPPLSRSPYTDAVPPSCAVIVSDAHLGYVPQSVSDAFHRFLSRVPDLGDHLVINGDLFEFLFEYRSVIPTSAFPTLERLAVLRRSGVRVTATGGNHDRWGGRFWRRTMEIDFHPRGAEFDVGGHAALVAHGDGLSETRAGARLLHHVVSSPITTTVFRWLHPDLGLALVRRLSPVLADKAKDARTRDMVAAAQERYARRLLSERKDLDLVVLGHTHQAAMKEIESGRWYLNPGAWSDGLRYALVNAAGPKLCRFEGG